MCASFYPKPRHCLIFLLFSLSFWDMAIVKTFHVCALLVVFIFANDIIIIPCQGNVACNTKKIREGGGACKGITKEGMHVVATSIDGSQRKHDHIGITEDTRPPTNNGHSPGAGHSLWIKKERRHQPFENTYIALSWFILHAYLYLYYE